MTKITRRATCLGSLMVLGTLVQVSPAAAAALTCGSIVNQSTTLTADIGPCANGGLVVRADNITVDLGGHVIRGFSNRGGDGVGVRIRNRTGVTVRNGRITDFVAGVVIENGSGNLIRDLLVKDNIAQGAGDFGDGIAISASSGNTVRDNNVIHNGPFDGIGLFGPSSNNLIVGNVVGENNVPFTGEDGIRIEGPGAKNNIVRSNSVTGSTLDGIAVFSDQATGNLNTGNVIVQNTVTANGFGFLGARPGDGIRTFLRANDNVIRNNQVHDNAGSGILIGSGSLNNEIVLNSATGNARQAAEGTRFDLHDLNPGCDNNRWANNEYVTAFPACTTG